MSIFVIEFQAIPRNLAHYDRSHRHIEVIRDSLEEAIDEIETEKEWGDNFVDMDTVIFDGPISGQGTRRYLLTWMKEIKGEEYQCSYIVREIEETLEVKNAIKRNELYRLLES